MIMLPFLLLLQLSYILSISLILHINNLFLIFQFSCLILIEICLNIILFDYLLCFQIIFWRFSFLYSFTKLNVLLPSRFWLPLWLLNCCLLKTWRLVIKFKGFLLNWIFIREFLSRTIKFDFFCKGFNNACICHGFVLKRDAVLININSSLFKRYFINFFKALILFLWKLLLNAFFISSVNTLVKLKGILNAFLEIWTRLILDWFLNGTWYVHLLPRLLLTFRSCRFVWIPWDLVNFLFGFPLLIALFLLFLLFYLFLNILENYIAWLLIIFPCKKINKRLFLPGRD